MSKGKSNLKDVDKVLDSNLFINTFYSNKFSFIQLLKKFGGTMHVEAAVLKELLVTNEYRVELINLFNIGILMLHDPENTYPEIQSKVYLTKNQRSIYRSEVNSIRSEFNKIEAEKMEENRYHRKLKNEGEIHSLALARVLHLPIICTDDSSVPKVIKRLNLQVLIKPETAGENDDSQHIQTYELLDLCEEIITYSLAPKPAIRKIFKNAVQGDWQEKRKMKAFDAIEEPIKNN